MKAPMRTRMRTFQHARCPNRYVLRVADYRRLNRFDLLRAAGDRGLGGQVGDNFDIVGRLIADDLRRAARRDGAR